MVRLLFPILGVFLIIFICGPILCLFSNLTSEVLFSEIFIKKIVLALWISFAAGVVSTIIGLVFGVPLGYLLARKNFMAKPLVEGIVQLPVCIPHSAAGIALLLFFTSEFLNASFIVDSFLGIVVGMFFASVPYLVSHARCGFESVDVKLEYTAQILGATPSEVFFKVSLPLCRRNILRGLYLMWARGVSEFGAVAVIAYHPQSAAVLTYDWLQVYGIKYASCAAAVIVLLSLVIFVVFTLFDRKCLR